MRRDLAGAASLIAALAAAAGACAQPGPAAPAAASPWRLIYENSQTAYYVDARGVQPSGQSDVEVLQDYKIAQVVDGSQAWSMISSMRLSCDAAEMLTESNTFYALKTGAGPVVDTQTVTDTWHRPEPDSLGGLIMSTVCARR